jgi:hypothetical protein
LLYTPTANYFGEDSFKVKVSDGISTDTINVNVIVSRDFTKSPPSKPSFIRLSSDTSSDGNYYAEWDKPSYTLFFEIAESKNGTESPYEKLSDHLIKNFENKYNGTYKYKLKACNEFGCSKEVISSEIIVNHPNPKIIYKYDALGRLIIIEDYQLGKRQYDFDAAGNRETVGRN